MAEPLLFTNASGTGTGSPLDATVFDALAVGGSCILSGAGSIPANSASTTLSMPALTTLVNTGAAAAIVSVIAQNVTMTGGASQDCYLYVNSSGAYSQLHVSTGTAAPATPAGTAPILFATTNAGNSALTSVTVIGSAYRLLPQLMDAAALNNPIDPSTIIPANGVPPFSASMQDTINWLSFLINARMRTDGLNAASVVTFGRVYRLPSGVPTLSAFTPAGSGQPPVTEWSVVSGGNDERGTIQLVPTTNRVMAGGVGNFWAIHVNFSTNYPGIPVVMLTNVGPTWIPLNGYSLSVIPGFAGFTVMITNGLNSSPFTVTTGTICTIGYQVQG